MKRLKSFLKKLPLGQQLIFTGVIVGVAAGVSSYFFHELILLFTRFGFEKLPALPSIAQKCLVLLLPTLGGLIAGVLTHHYCPQAKGHGVFEVIKSIQEEEGRIPGRVAWVKSVASAATIGSGGSGGSLMPALFIGASLGSASGGILQSWTGLTNQPGAFAVVGMASVFTAAFHAPVTAIVMVFELTRDYGMILPVMLSCAIAYVVSKPLQLKEPEERPMEGGEIG